MTRTPKTLAEAIAQETNLNTSPLLAYRLIKKLRCLISNNRLGLNTISFRINQELTSK
jgi:hypothetical protein